jgi:hypothetical protein
MDWHDYQSSDPGLARPLDEATPAEARAFFEALMEDKAERKQELTRLCAAYGIDLDESDESVEALDAWFRTHVEASPDDPGRPAARWFMVVKDVGLYLGDLLVDRVPGLEWRMFTSGKTAVSYQRPVVMGFGSSVDPRYHIDPELLVSGYAHRVLGGARYETGYFLKFLKAAERMGCRAASGG